MLRNIIYGIVIILLLSTGFIYSNELYNGVVSAKQFWFYGAMSLLLVFSLTNLLFAKINIKLNYTDLFVLGYSLWCLIRAFFTPFTPFFNDKIISLLLLVCFYFIVKNQFTLKNNDFIKKILLIALLFTASIQSLIGLFQLYNILPSFNPLFKITGTFINPAPYGFFLATICPVSLSIYLFFSTTTFLDKVLRYFSLITFILILMIIPAIFIRTAWLGIIGGLLIVFEYKYKWVSNKIYVLLDTSLKKIFALVLVLCLGILSCYYLYQFKKDSAFGRLFVWEVSADMIKSKPIVGIGFTRYESDYNIWQANYFKTHEEQSTKENIAGNVQFAYNEYIEIFSETGILGLLLFGGIIISTIRGTIKTKILNQKSTSSSDNKNYNNPSLNDIFIIASIASIVSLFIMAIFSYPFYNLTTRILLFFFLGILSALTNQSILIDFDSQISIKEYSLKAILIFVFGLTGYLALNNLTTKLGAFKVWNIANYNAYYNKFDIAQSNYKLVYHRLKNDGSFLLQYGKCLSMNKEWKNSERVLIEASKLSSDPYLFLNLGDCHRVNKVYNKAEQSYLLANYIIPHKIYPKYRLMMLYDEQNIKDKVLETAHKILNMPVKIDSEAINEIKEITKKMIQKYDK